MERARPVYAYDNYTADGNNASILGYGVITGHDAAYGVMKLTRGNVTGVGRWLDSPTPTTIYSYSRYDEVGNVVSMKDARGNVAQVEYSSTYQYAYPTRTISPTPDTGNNFCSTTPLETLTSYDFSTGLVISSTDANNQTTSYVYDDSLNRPTTVTRPTGGGSTTYIYDDTPGGVYVGTLTTQSASVTFESYQRFDGFGRPYRSFQSEYSDPAQPWLTSDTQYDALGRVWRVSDTYRSSGSASAINPSGIWTTSAYDALGRVTSVTTSDNAVVVTSYSGNQVTVTDQAGKKRSSVTDALGRLTQVIEDPGGSLAAQTYYTYDVLGNLRKVEQGTQSRHFMYDSLSRLTRARNPEQNVNANLTGTDPVTGNAQWSISYAYDNNGNLSTKTDARNLTATYSYDNINRNTQVSYSDGTLLHHLYDGAANGRGRSRAVFYYVGSGANSQTLVNNYDAMGRPLNQLQYFFANGVWGTAYTVSRTYDWAGHVTSQTYPSGRNANYAYDRLGRTTSFTGDLGDSVSRTYMTAPTFDDAGRMIREQFGTDIPLYNKRHYNQRGQLYDMRLSSINNDTDWDRGAIVNYYSLSNYGFGTSGTDNNGNLYVQQHWIPGGASMQQNYAYDSLNRISSVGEYQNGATLTGVQNYNYDRWGNRTIATSSYGTGINTKQFTVDSATNRLGVPAGQSGAMQYDASGNLLNDTYTSYGSRTYDVENRMLTAWDSNGQQSIYTYDGDGRRVRRQTIGQTTWQVYGIDGELLAEYVTFLQNASSSVISQSISGFQSATTYSVKFKAAQRANCCGYAGQDFQLMIDNNSIGTFRPPGTAYAEMTSISFTTTSGAHTLKFVGIFLKG